MEKSKPGYMVTEELDRDKLKKKAGMRDWKYKRKLGESRGGKLARACWEEIKNRAKKGEVKGEWEDERKQFMEEKH